MSMNLAQLWSVHQEAFWYPNFSHSFFYIHYLSFAPREDSFTSLQNIQLENPWKKTEELLPCPTPPVSPFTSCLSLPPYKTKAGWRSKNNLPWGSRMTQSPPHLVLVKDCHQNGQMSQLSSSRELTTLQLGSLEEEGQRFRSPSFLSKGRCVWKGSVLSWYKVVSDHQMASADRTAAEGTEVSLLLSLAGTNISHVLPSLHQSKAKLPARRLFIRAPEATRELSGCSLESG